MKPRILILTQNPSNGAGAERVIANLTAAISEDFDFFLVFPQTSGKGVSDINYSGQLVPLNLPKVNKNAGLIGKSRRYVKVLKILKKCFDEIKPDLIMSNLSMDWHQMMILMKTLRLTSAKAILRFGNPITPALKGRSKIASQIFRKIASNVDLIIANSEGTKRDIETWINAQSTKIKVIYNPLKLDEIKALSKHPVDDAEVFTKDLPVIINVGRLDTQKNQGLLIRAFAEIRKNRPCNLVLIGSGPLMQEFQALSSELGVQESVHFLGWQNNPYKYVSRSSVFALTSVYEGFGNVIVEAMACGCPVVSTNALGAPSELLGITEYGIIVKSNKPVDIAQTIEKLLADEELRVAYIEKGIERSKMFDYRKVGKDYGQVFTDLIKDEKL